MYWIVRVNAQRSDVDTPLGLNCPPTSGRLGMEPGERRHEHMRVVHRPASGLQDVLDRQFLAIYIEDVRRRAAERQGGADEIVLDRQDDHALQRRRHAPRLDLATHQRQLVL